MKKLKIFSILIGLMFLLVACDGDNKQSELPPGYGMLCNSDSTKFVATMPSEFRLYRYDRAQDTPYNNYRDAIKYAWGQYEHVSPPPDTIKYQECN